MGGIAVSILLLLANGLFVAAEFSFLASRRSRMEQLAAEGDRRAAAAAGAIGELSFMLSAAQLGITMASLVLGYVAEPTVAHLLEAPLHDLGLPDATSHTVAFVVALVIVVFLHMVVGEMIPKNIAIAEPDRTALWLAVPMRAFATLFRPVVRLLNHSANASLRLLGVEPRDTLSEARTGDELADLLAVSRREGLLEEVEHRLMTGALRFPVRQVATVMVPLARVVSVPAGTTVERLEDVVLTSGHSRIVLHGAGHDDVLGFVHAKDLLEVDPAGRNLPLRAERIRRMLVVGAERTLQHALVAMRKARVHVAVVVDEGGRPVGMVTLEDVLEALVGDIRDEHDRPPPPLGQAEPR